MFDRILVPIDSSEDSIKALKTAVEFAKKCGSGKITLIHVYSTKTIRLGVATIVLPAEEIRKGSASILANGEKIVKAEGLDVEKLSVEGHVTGEIVKTARKGKFDLIVVGHRGLSKISYLLLGHVSEGVIRHAPCPVVVVR